MDARILAVTIFLASVILISGCIGAQRSGSGSQIGNHPLAPATPKAGGSLGDSEISPASQPNDDPVLSDEDVIPPSDEGAVLPQDGLAGQTGEAGSDTILLTDSDIAVSDIPEADLISLEDVVEPG